MKFGVMVFDQKTKGLERRERKRDREDGRGGENSERGREREEDTAV